MQAKRAKGGLLLLPRKYNQLSGANIPNIEAPALRHNFGMFHAYLILLRNLGKHRVFWPFFLLAEYMILIIFFLSMVFLAEKEGS